MVEINNSLVYQTFINDSDSASLNFSSQNYTARDNQSLSNDDEALCSSDSVVAEFVIQGLAITLTAVLGLVGNILSVITFLRMKRKSSFTCFLLGLTFCDSVLVTSSILIFGIPSMLKLFDASTCYIRIYPYLLFYLYPIAHSAQTGSVYFTLVVTIERYCAVCFPLQSRSSRFLATWKRGIYVSIFILLFAIGFTLPRWMEYVVTVTNNKVGITTTALRRDPEFVKYYIHYAYFIVLFAVPILMLTILNTVIYKEIQKTNRIRQELSILQTSEINLALMLIIVVAVFLLCNILPLVNNLMEFCCDVSRTLIFLGNLLVAFNSSINFLIYYSFGERFRRCFRATCMKVFCLCLPPTIVDTSQGKRGSSVYFSGKTNTMSMSSQRTTFSRISVSVISNGPVQMNDKIHRIANPRRHNSVPAT